MEWYDDRNKLAEAVQFVMKFSCCFGWTAFASDKTPCCNYKEEDRNIPQGLKDAIKEYIGSLTTEEHSDLMREMALLLGEKFYIREATVVKVLSRILADGDVRENKGMLILSLMTQVNKRMELLEALRAS
ncbi:hypothetical protein SAMN02910292_01359 [Lachnospiraceae bacterium XBB2008]|nr:hypothetical protein SAMN02910292_01359 [Lachnospiraceae bacterium XBB2008]